jgi:hypothetical protein
MKNPIALFALLILSSALSADELVLKNGTNIPWKSITNDGNNLIVVTEDGKKLTVLKSDVDKITTVSKEAPIGGPLTGASFTFDKKRKLTVIDLLATIDAKRDGITGTWTKGKTLVGAPPTEATAKCQIGTYTPPLEYDLTVVLERKEAGAGGNGMSIGFISPIGRQCEFQPDHRAGTLTMFADKSWPGKFFENNKPRTLTLMVRTQGLVIQADGKDFMVWSGDWKTVGDTTGQAQKPNVLYFTTYAVYSISQITLTAPKQ